MLNGAKPLSNNNSWAEKDQRKSPRMNQSNQKGPLRKKKNSEKNKALQNAEKNNKTTKKRSSDRRSLVKSSKKQHSENTDMWHLCKAGSFSYGESPRTPPLEGTSLHR